MSYVCNKSIKIQDRRFKLEVVDFSNRLKWVEYIPKVLFPHSVKIINSASDKKGVNKSIGSIIFVTKFYSAKFPVNNMRYEYF